MASFLMNCPQCNSLIAKIAPCPECGWSEQPNAATPAAGPSVAQAFAHRRWIHQRNYALFMILMLGTGLIGVLTAFMWIRLMYLGDLVALVMIGFFTVLTGILGVLVTFSKKLFPIELNCPACNVRLDELGPLGDQCPGCDSVLR